MAGLARYESGGLHTLDGLMLAELTKVTIRDKGNLYPVYTTAQGLAGTADGPLEVEVMYESAMPKAGAEFDYINALRTRKVMMLRIRSEGVTHSYEVKVSDSERQLDTTASATKSITMIGKFIGATT